MLPQRGHSVCYCVRAGVGTTTEVLDVVQVAAVQADLVPLLVAHDLHLIGRLHLGCTESCEAESHFVTDYLHMALGVPRLEAQDSAPGDSARFAGLHCFDLLRVTVIDGHDSSPGWCCRHVRSRTVCQRVRRWSR